MITYIGQAPGVPSPRPPMVSLRRPQIHLQKVRHRADPIRVGNICESKTWKSRYARGAHVAKRSSIGRAKSNRIGGSLVHARKKPAMVVSPTRVPYARTWRSTE